MRIVAVSLAGLCLSACVSAEPPSGAVAPSIAAPESAAATKGLPEGAYTLDPSHTSVIWRVSHFGLSMYTGRFNLAAADLDFDPDDPEQSSLKVEIEARSVDTGFKALGRDSDFDAEIAAVLGAAETPKITFVSTAIEETGPATGRVTGDLTLNGVTKPATLDVTFYGGRKSPLDLKTHLGFAARGVIKRSDWGVTEWAGPVGDEVQLVIEAEFVKA